jgi:cystathionine beta-lyase
MIDPQTRLLHPDYRPPAGFAAINDGIFRASTVLFPNVAAMRARDWRQRDGYTYGLHGTPTTFVLEDKLAAIEGARHALLAPSGLAAIANVNLALLKAGDELLLPENVYGPNRELAENLLSGYGIGHRLYDPLDPASLDFRPSTRLVWFEAPGSVTMEVPDVPALVARARAAGVVTAIDNTYAAGLAFKPLALGVDVCVQALTKFHSGAGDVLMGAVYCNDEALHLKLKYAHMRLGLGVGGDDAYLVLRGLPTMKLRFDASDAAGRRVAAWLAEQPQVRRLLHPAFASCPGHAHWRRDFSGAAGLFSVLIDPRYGQAEVDAFVDALRIFKIGYSWAGPISLAVPYDLAAMRPLSGTKLAAEGRLVRFWIGLEAVEDLLSDLKQALDKTLG